MSASTDPQPPDIDPELFNIAAEKVSRELGPLRPALNTFPQRLKIIAERTPIVEVDWRQAFVDKFLADARAFEAKWANNKFTADAYKAWLSGQESSPARHGQQNGPQGTLRAR